MDAPVSFWKMAMRFHQDVPSFVEANETALADYLVSGLAPMERRELAGFLDTVLAMPDAGSRLMGLWNKSQADFRYTRVNEIAGLFATIRNRL